MKIISKGQFNQGISKYKLLSSTAGVGSIVTTKFGNYVILKDINQWPFFSRLNSLIQQELSKSMDEEILKRVLVSYCEQNGIDLIQDSRFVDFLALERGIDNLKTLVGLPHISLTDNLNTPNWKNHPIKKLNPEATLGGFLIQGELFPKWFRNSKGDFKELYKWKKEWEKACKDPTKNITPDQFAPPRDAGAKPYSTRSITNVEKRTVDYSEYPTLIQNNLILQCHNGHLSDIPWPKFLRWKTEKRFNGNSQGNESDLGERLFDIEDCCSSPELKWSENKIKSEGYGSIYLECKKCGHGSGKLNFPKITLEGINNIQPLCRGEKPWESTFKDDIFIKSIEKCEKSRARNCCANSNHTQEHMSVTLVTANNTYYANTFSSVYIPEHLIDNTPKEYKIALEKVNKIYKNKLKRNPNLEKEEFVKVIDTSYLEDKFEDDGVFFEGDFDKLTEYVKNKFITESQGARRLEGVSDLQVFYRYDEYKCFINNDKVGLDNLTYGKVELAENLSAYFEKILQIEELNVTSVQLNFSRIRPIERIRNGNDQIVNSTEGQTIYSNNSQEMYALPAVLLRGEGIFIQFKESMIQQWIDKNANQLLSRFERQIAEPNVGDAGEGMRMKIFQNNYKFYLVHSFSHMLMRELEFTCGYPTASLKERLYISNNADTLMSGVLIYTSDGAEGSMGGLMNQAFTDNFEELIENGLRRVLECSSDPLCWESEGQGIYGLNLSSCFACSLISETACEEMNLGLDRRVLVDQDFGFFKDQL